MTAPAPGTVCPRTGRTWPAAAGFDLRTCTTCHGVIDVRHEAWWDASRAGGGAAHVTCPPALPPPPSHARLEAITADNPPCPLDDP